MIFMDVVTRLSFLFGTKEAIARRKLLVILREKVYTLCVKKSGFNEGFVICSESLGEGFLYPSSDDDLVFVDERPSLRVYGSYGEALQNRALFMIPSVQSPGFCVLQSTEDSGFAIVSSKLFRECFVESNPNQEEHGPCTSFTNGIYEYDHAMCLSCSSWPTMAREWIVRRRRYGWPSRELIQMIVKGGCHFVPIGNPDSSLRDIEWRVSFSLAERSLIHKFNHVQFLVYNVLKLILKKVIEICIPNVLCSYFIKTVMFFVIENTCPALWLNHRLEECYKKSLSKLYHFINTRECPNFFVPSNNMMKRKVNTDNRPPLLDVVNELMTLGIVGSLNLCGDIDVVGASLSPVLSLADVEMKQDVDLCCGYLLWAAREDCSRFIQENTRRNNIQLTLRKVLLHTLHEANHQVVSKDIICLIIRHIFVQMGRKCIELSQGVKGGNKSRYQMLLYGQTLLSKGYSTDISSGRLVLSNYMLMTGRYSSALAIIIHVLSKYAPYVIPGRSNPATKELHMEILCNKNYSLIDKLKRGWALDVEFSRACGEMVPVPIRMIQTLTGHRIFIPALVCAYFLQGISFYNTHNTASLNISVASLEDSVRGLPSQCLHGIFFGSFLLGYMRMLQQNYDSSFRCLTAAYSMKDRMDKEYKEDYTKCIRACLILLACLLNQVFNKED